MVGDDGLRAALVAWVRNALSTYHPVGTRERVGYDGLPARGAGAGRREPETAKAATNSAAINHNARSRPTACARKPIAGGPAKLAR